MAKQILSNGQDIVEEYVDVSAVKSALLYSQTHEQILAKYGHYDAITNIEKAISSLTELQQELRQLITQIKDEEN